MRGVGGGRTETGADTELSVMVGCDWWCAVHSQDHVNVGGLRSTVIN